MCMSCNTEKLTTKKKIILFSSLGVGVAVVMYFVLTTTNNPALAVGIPTVLAFGICPLMCAAMGGAMWISMRFSKNKNKHASEHPDSSVAQKTSCCEVSQENREQQQKLENGAKVEEMKRNNSIPIPKQQNKLYEN